jgi:hypothetical protein
MKNKQNTYDRHADISLADAPDGMFEVSIHMNDLEIIQAGYYNRSSVGFSRAARVMKELGVQDYVWYDWSETYDPDDPDAEPETLTDDEFAMLTRFCANYDLLVNPSNREVEQREIQAGRLPG